MFDEAFLEKLKKKYRYDNKTINALSKIIPSVIKFYGKDYEDIILEAIFNCEIISCNSHQTISNVLRDKKLTPVPLISSLSDIDIKRSESVYVPNLCIVYDSNSNSYQIDKINRVIVTSHTYNYDSLKGLEVLTHAICHLVKSYKNELVIDENVLLIRNGMALEKRKIIYDGEISLEFMEDSLKGLEEGFTLYDTECIVSSIYKDNYKCYDYDSLYAIASILKNKYGLMEEINEYEVKGDLELFEKKYGKDMINSLTRICDSCAFLENEMYLSVTREDKNNYVKQINKLLSEDMYSVLVSMYQKKVIQKNNYV